jgi:hypothetical protein
MLIETRAGPTLVADLSALGPTEMLLVFTDLDGVSGTIPCSEEEAARYRPQLLATGAVDLQDAAGGTRRVVPVAWILARVTADGGNEENGTTCRNFGTD